MVFLLVTALPDVAASAHGAFAAMASAATHLVCDTGLDSGRNIASH